MVASLRQALTRALADDEAVLPRVDAAYLTDATATRGIAGEADAVVRPRDARAVATTLEWASAHDVPVTPRGGGTGLSGGAVPGGGIVLSLERLRGVRALDLAAWRIAVEAGLPTAALHRLARENGLLFAPDPGAAEQSQVGGNVATDAGGPHAFKYGTTRAWVTGIDAVLASGERIAVGGAHRREVTGYSLKDLLIGSEGTLAVITAVTLHLVPAPEVSLPVVAVYRGADRGCEALAAVLEAGVTAAALEFLDAGALAAARASAPFDCPPEASFAIVADADGSAAEAKRLRAELLEQLEPGALAIDAPHERAAAQALWRWRGGVSPAVAARRGGKLSEDLVVPVERLAEAIARTTEIGARHGLEACSWGHAGDGNLHSTFLLDPRSSEALGRAEAAASELFALARALGGAISGEHGVGLVKAAHVTDGWSPAVARLQRELKRLFDPKGLLNPGKKVPLGETAGAGPPPRPAGAEPRPRGVRKASVPSSPGSGSERPGRPGSATVHPRRA